MYMHRYATYLVVSSSLYLDCCIVTYYHLKTRGPDGDKHTSMSQLVSKRSIKITWLTKPYLNSGPQVSGPCAEIPCESSATPSILERDRSDELIWRLIDVESYLRQRCLGPFYSFPGCYRLAAVAPPNPRTPEISLYLFPCLPASLPPDISRLATRGTFCLLRWRLGT